MILMAAVVTVRLFWLHPPSSVRIDGIEFRADRPVARQFHGRTQIEAAGSPPLSVEGPLDLQTRESHLLLTLHMPLEDYVAGVLAGESSIFRSAEALKAMAVTARTYAVYHRRRHATEGFDFCDTTHCQDLRLAARSERLRTAVEDTEAELLWYEGAPADSYYSRHCGGTTEAGQAPYLRQLTDTFCIAAGRAAWHCELRKRDLGGPLAILRHTASGRVAEVSIAGRPMRANEFQLAVGRALGWDTLRSNFYEIFDHGDRVLFQGYGSGHGIGLCQTGAEQRGLQGHTYRQILAFYFPGTVLGVAAQGFPWTRLDGERVVIYSTHPHEDRDTVRLADRALREAERSSGMQFAGRPSLRVYPTVAAFRDATGEPGYVAASTAGRTVRMQPAALLRSMGRLDSTLLHEMLHVVVESAATPGTPAWFREGIVLYLAGASTEPRAGNGAEPEMRRDYNAALARVRALISRYGRERVIGWIRTGSAELAAGPPR